MYHVTDPEDPKASGDDGNPGSPVDWRIALRVEPDAEGPSAGKLKLAATNNNNQVRETKREERVGEGGGGGGEQRE